MYHYKYVCMEKTSIYVSAVSWASIETSFTTHVPAEWEVNSIRALLGCMPNLRYKSTSSYCVSREMILVVSLIMSNRVCASLTVLLCQLKNKNSKCHIIFMLFYSIGRVTHSRWVECELGSNAWTQLVPTSSYCDTGFHAFPFNSPWHSWVFVFARVRRPLRRHEPTTRPLKWHTPKQIASQRLLKRQRARHFLQVHMYVFCRLHHIKCV